MRQNGGQNVEIDQTVQEIEKIYTKKAEAARIRSKTVWYEQGETSSKYFHSLEKKKGQDKMWSKVKTENGEIKGDTQSILNEQVKFYKKLYTSEGFDNREAQSLIENIESSLTDEQKNKCDKDITEGEIRKAIKSMANEKSPGIDGIPKEFYEIYMDLIVPDLLEVIQEVEQTNSLSVSQSRGVITLFYKAGGREIIANWRPITLLCVDYKIIAKVMAIRLKGVLKDIVHEDQKAFVSGRQILEGITQIRDVIEYTEMENTEAAIIFLDQQKAFDRVEWGYVNMVLKKFNFGEKFIKWVNILYKDSTSTILTNGFMSNTFKLSRSLRQGCPLAPLLYIVQAEPLSSKIRKDENIRGIRLPNKDKLKVLQFADDTQIFVTDKRSIDKVFETLVQYSKASGAKVNKKKTQILGIGAWTDNIEVTSGVKWVKGPVKALGVYYGERNMDVIYDDMLSKVKSRLQMWSHRRLTLQGKVYLVKSIGLSVWHHIINAEVVPTQKIKQLEDIIWSFIWENKRGLVNRAVCSQPKEKGGLGMISISDIIVQKHVKFVSKVIKEKGKWTVLSNHWYTSLDEKFDERYFLLKCNEWDLKDIKNIPKYQVNTLKSWYEFKGKAIDYYKTPMQDQTDRLFGNKNIKIDNKVLQISNWSKSGVKSVRNVVSEGQWVPEQQLLLKLNNRRNWLVEMMMVKRAIPREMRMIKDAYGNDDVDEREFQKMVEMSKSEVKKIIVNRTVKVKSEDYWTNKFGNNIEFSAIYKSIWKSTAERKVKQFIWKCFHGVINTESKMQRMKISQRRGMCQMCDRDIENQEHLFMYCQKVGDYWCQVEEMIQSTTKVKVKLKEQDILLMYRGEKESDVNEIIFNSKWLLWKRRNLKIFEKHDEEIKTTLQKLREKRV